MSDLGALPPDRPSLLDRRFHGLPVVAWAAIALVVAIVVAAIATAPARAARANAEQQERIADVLEAMSPVEVTYEVDGTADVASLTYSTPTGTEQITAGIPVINKAGTRGLRLSFDPGSFVYISAQNQHDNGTVTCRILVEDEVISENTSSGAYGIASCDGTS